MSFFEEARALSWSREPLGGTRAARPATVAASGTRPPPRSNARRRR
eukprot:CAMPEP_0206041540 /NCGR_PEP_ID=MMETSP1466-20131121/6024_1 /ASSEMBLY_ACC=CAM_ASM_001126 /TAXON_ID=44452 /ORGANISM="Pavlova gyrans, Strain CCMP608" /LENGTH=45 /DNA_ID= /DNA_START= /DNA_END= /DNA_ORIENTATION=